MRCALPCLHLVKSEICMSFGPRLLATKFVARREAAFVITIRELSLRASLRFARLPTIVASGLVSVLCAEPCLHLVVPVLDMCPRPWL